MEVIINHPYTETGQGHLPRNFLLANLVNLPSRKNPGISVLTTINKYLIPAQDQHSFIHEHSTTSALLQLTTDVAVGFNQRKPSDRTVCVAVDLSAAFDTVSLSLFSFYIADMPILTESVKRVCYADDLTVWASEVNIPDLEVSINNYLEEITAYLKDNSLLISAPKFSVTLFTPDTHQAKIHPRIFIENSHLPLVKCPRILGVYLDPSLSFNKHSQYVAERVSGRNNILKALAGTSWGQQKETLLMTYKAVGRSIINYAAPVHETYMTPTTEKSNTHRTRL